MEGTTILTIAIPALVALAVLVLYTTAQRRDTDRAVAEPEPEKVHAGAPASGREVERQATLERRAELAPFQAAPLAPYVAPDRESVGVTRRQFFNRGIVSMFTLSLSGFGAACLAFLWPQGSSGFGSKINVGSVDDVLAEIGETREPFYVPEGRFFVNPFPKDAVSKAESIYGPSELAGMEAGVVALYQKCPHLGCRVPWCVTSQWFECPCHGSQYNRAGEKKAGPAPRGMDRFPVKVSGGSMEVDTGIVIQGPPIGTNTTGQEAEGPHCITGGE